MDALSSIPYLLTFDGFEELLEIKPDSRGRGTRALGAVLILLTFFLVSCSALLTIAVANVNGSTGVMAEQLCGVLAQVILVIISGQPAQPPLFVCVDLNGILFVARHRQSSVPWFLDGYTKQAKTKKLVKI